MSQEPSRRAVRKQTRVLVLQRDSFRCRFCGTTAEESRLQVDHVKQKARGGTDTPENLATLCEDCNAGKNDLWLGDCAALIMKGTVGQPAVRQQVSPPLDYTRDASQALDETSAEQRFDRYKQSLPPRLSGWSTGIGP